MKIFHLILAYITPPSCFYAENEHYVPISKLSFANFECSACTTSLETLQELFSYYQNILHWALTIKLWEIIDIGTLMKC